MRESSEVVKISFSGNRHLRYAKMTTPYLIVLVIYKLKNEFLKKKKGWKRIATPFLCVAK